MSISHIRLVTFDALHTLIKPRQPIHVQYSQVFAPYLGTLDPRRIRESFKVALKEVQQERPSYLQGVRGWWEEVIKRTALGAGANEEALNSSLSEIVTSLMTRFSSKEGYEAFDDANPVIGALHENGIMTSVISNGDPRIRNVLKDLDFPVYLNPIVLSDEEGIEKPSNDIFMRTVDRINAGQSSIVTPSECLHIGDELVCDYHGARNANFNALLLRRSGAAGEEAHKELGERTDGVQCIENLKEVLPWIKSKAPKRG